MRHFPNISLKHSEYPTQRVLVASATAFRYNNGIWIKNNWQEHRGKPNVQIMRELLDKEIDPPIFTCVLADTMIQYFRSLTWRVLSGDNLDHCQRYAHFLSFQTHIPIHEFEFVSRMPHQYFLYNSNNETQILLDKVLHSL